MEQPVRTRSPHALRPIRLPPDRHDLAVSRGKGSEPWHGAGCLDHVPGSARAKQAPPLAPFSLFDSVSLVFPAKATPANVIRANTTPGIRP